MEQGKSNKQQRDSAINFMIGFVCLVILFIIIAVIKLV